MSKHVYNDPKDPVELIGGWKVSNAVKGITYSNEATGFKSALYERTVDGKTEYTYATAGTEGLDGKDWKANATQLVGASEQYSQSKANAVELKNELKGAELTFTGHSLGGGLAEGNSIATGNKEITFNAAGVSVFTRGGHSGRSNTDAYIMTTDPLNAIQIVAGGVLRAGGERHFLQPRSASGTYNGHSINSVIEALQSPVTPIRNFINNLKQAITPKIF